PQEVRTYVWEIVNIILKMDIKLLVIACNTATAFVLDDIKQKVDIPVIGVINPGARAAIKATRNKTVGVIGTQGTVESNAYPKALKGIDSNLTVYTLACPLFVPMIERGKFMGDEVKKIVAETLSPIIYKDIDTIILGCTHYPIISETIQSVVGEKVSVVSSSDETAKEIKSVLEVNKLYNYNNEIFHDHEFYVTDRLNVFESIANNIFKRQFKMTKIDLGKSLVNIN